MRAGALDLPGRGESEARTWEIAIQIQRAGQLAFSGENIRRTNQARFEELAEYLFRSQVFPYGAILLTGTGIVPPDTFTLQERDEIAIEISGIGLLRNTVKVV